MKTSGDDIVKQGADALVRLRMLPALKKLMDIIDISPTEAARALRPHLAELEPEEREHLLQGLRYASTLFSRIHEHLEQGD